MSDSLWPPWTASCQASLSIINSQSLLKLMSIESVMTSNHFILCHPLLLLPSIFPSISIFSNELALHIRWPKYWNFSIGPSNEHSRLVSFRIYWLDLLAVQGILKNLIQHHSPKSSVLWCSAFCIVWLSHPYVTTGKTIALSIQTFVYKVMSLLFNMLSRLGIGFLSRSKCLLISWLQSPSAAILEPKKIKSVTVSIVFPSLGWDLPTLQADSLPSEPLGKPKNTGVGSPSLLQEIFPTQGSTQALLHCRWILYQLSHQGILPTPDIVNISYAEAFKNCLPFILWKYPWQKNIRGSLSCPFL